MVGDWHRTRTLPFVIYAKQEPLTQSCLQIALQIFSNKRGPIIKAYVHVYVIYYLKTFDFNDSPFVACARISLCFLNKPQNESFRIHKKATVKLGEYFINVLGFLIIDVFLNWNINRESTMIVYKTY